MALLGIEYDIRPTSSLTRARSAPNVPRTRRLAPEQLHALQDFFVRLDRDSRCRRFGYAASDDGVVAHAGTALEDPSCVIGVFVDESLRGVLEIYCCAPRPYSEAALVVSQDWRRRGLGWALLRAAATWVGEVRGHGIHLIFTRDNWPMRQLANKANARFDLMLDEICAEITPAMLRS
jgi:GNAT superfamily N-acetyltransferase